MSLIRNMRITTVEEFFIIFPHIDALGRKYISKFEIYPFFDEENTYYDFAIEFKEKQK